MTDIVTERSGSILRIQFNRPAKKNAMTFAMYNTMADLFNTTANDDTQRSSWWAIPRRSIRTANRFPASRK
jgi:enoyl-CoA hydratase/carnithine racemase